MFANGKLDQFTSSFAGDQKSGLAPNKIVYKSMIYLSMGSLWSPSMLQAYIH